MNKNIISMYEKIGKGYTKGWWTNCHCRYRVFKGARNTKKSYVMIGLEVIDKIAEKLSEKQGNTPIILQVDGKTFAQISVDSINSLTKQTGKLPLKLA